VTRLAVITTDRVRVFEGRRSIAEYELQGPVDADTIEMARGAPEAPMPEPEQPRRPVVGFFTPSWGRLQ
jgi:hypothetical protein